MADLNWEDKENQFLNLVTSKGHEGGYVSAEKAEELNDPGGETNYGISRKFLKLAYKGGEDGKLFKGKTGSEIDLKTLSKEDAHTIYKDEFLKATRSNYGKNEFAFKMADIAINAGAGIGTEIMQRSLRDMGEEISADGFMGDETTKAFNKVYNNPPLRNVLMNNIIKHQESYYTGEGEAFKTKNINKDVGKNFQGGWNKRAKKTFKDIMNNDVVGHVLNSDISDNFLA
jgi:lysozyme family protein